MSNPEITQPEEGNFNASAKTESLRESLAPEANTEERSSSEIKQQLDAFFAEQGAQNVEFSKQDPERKAQIRSEAIDLIKLWATSEQGRAVAYDSSSIESPEHGAAEAEIIIEALKMMGITKESLRTNSSPTSEELTRTTDIRITEGDWDSSNLRSIFQGENYTGLALKEVLTGVEYTRTSSDTEITVELVCFPKEKQPEPPVEQTLSGHTEQPLVERSSGEKPPGGSVRNFE